MSKYKEISIVIGVVILSLSVGMVFATWQEPTASPPSNNIEVPINVSSNTQEKLGKLIVNSLDSTSSVYAVGQVTAGNEGFVTGASSLTDTILTVGSGGDSSIGGNLTVSGTSSLATTSFSNTRISDLLTPTLESDAATKGYVDSLSGGGGYVSCYALCAAANTISCNEGYEQVIVGGTVTGCGGDTGEGLINLGSSTYIRTWYTNNQTACNNDNTGGNAAFCQKYRLCSEIGTGLNRLQAETTCHYTQNPPGHGSCNNNQLYLQATCGVCCNK